MLLLANSIDVSEVPSEIKILPLGDVESRKGHFKVDDNSVQLIINGFKERKLDLVIDYEHQTLDNVQAPAAGWIKDIYEGTDALIAKVEWTDRAKQYLASKEYRYLSPVVMVGNQGGQAVGLHSVALTNSPAIDGMFPIVNSLTPQETPEQASDDILTALRKLLGLSIDSGTDKIISKIQGLLQAKAETENELQSMKYESYEKQVDDAVQYALKTGKITSHMVDSAKQMALKDLVAYKEYVSNAPVIVPLGRMNLEESARAKGTSSEINNLLGISDEDVMKYNC